MQLTLNDATETSYKNGFRSGYEDAIIDVLTILYGTKKDVMLKENGQFLIGYLKGGVLGTLNEVQEKIQKLRDMKNEQ